MRHDANARRKWRALGITSLAAVIVAAVGGVLVTTFARPGTAAAQQYGPVNTALPTITGTAREGQTLSATRGSWQDESSLSFAFQWQRCNPGGQNCENIAGATQVAFTLSSVDVGRTIRIRVTASNAQGSTAATSAATAVVEAAGAAIPVSAVSLPNRLVIEVVSFSPSPLRSRLPFQARVTVTDVNGIPVRDAIVFIRGIPERRIQPEAEARTGSDGRVTFTLEPTQLLPLQAGGRLTMFVRARKDGDRIIAGVTGTRLVSLSLSTPG